jgi:hypothetical protein
VSCATSVPGLRELEALGFTEIKRVAPATPNSAAKPAAPDLPPRQIQTRKKRMANH